MLSAVSVISIGLVPALLGTSPRADRARGDSARADSTSEVRAVGVLETASRLLGTRYKFGGTKPGAFDCSGFVRYVFARHGIALPRTAREQAGVGQSVVGGLDSLRTGDLLFFRTHRGRAAHVAIYVGAGRIVHASAGSRRVRYDELASSRGRWFVTHLSSVRRIIDE